MDAHGWRLVFDSTLDACDGSLAYAGWAQCIMHTTVNDNGKLHGSRRVFAIEMPSHYSPISIIPLEE